MRLGRISVCCGFCFCFVLLYKESSRCWIRCEVYSRRPLCRKFGSCFSKNLLWLYAQLWQQVCIIDIILCFLYYYDVFRQSIFKYKTSPHHLGKTQFRCITLFYTFCLFAFEPGCHTVTQAGSIARYVIQAGLELTVIPWFSSQVLGLWANSALLGSPHHYFFEGNNFPGLCPMILNIRNLLKLHSSLWP